MALRYYPKRYGEPMLSVAVCRVPSRRLEDHIIELCAKVIVAPETELEPVLSELKTALREHNVKLRRLAAEKLTGVEPALSERQAIRQQPVIFRTSARGLPSHMLLS
jgi:hypothetical protein